MSYLDIHNVYLCTLLSAIDVAGAVWSNIDLKAHCIQEFMLC